MTPKDPKEAAEHLNKFYSEKTIARMVKTDPPTTQPTIHKIIHSNQIPQWPLGNALIVLARKCRRKAK